MFHSPNGPLHVKRIYQNFTYIFQIHVWVNWHTSTVLFACALAFKRMIAQNSMSSRAFLLVRGMIQYLVHPKGKFWSFFFNKSFRMSYWHLIKPFGLPRTLYWAFVTDIPTKNPVKNRQLFQPEPTTSRLTRQTGRFQSKKMKKNLRNHIFT